jgi:hypothetical protein
MDSWSSTGVTVVAGFNAPSPRPPFGHTMLHTVRAEALPSQEIDRVERHHAVRAAAIRHDVAAFLQLAEAFPEVGERHGDRARYVSREVLLTGTDVDEGDLAGADTPHELVVANRLKRTAFFEVLARHLLDLGQPRFRQASQLEKELAHVRVREPVRDVQARLLGLDQMGASEHLQVVRSRRDTLAGLVGERFDRPVSLGQEIEELETVWARCGLADARDILVDSALQ